MTNIKISAEDERNIDRIMKRFWKYPWLFCLAAPLAIYFRATTKESIFSWLIFLGVLLPIGAFVYGCFKEGNLREDAEGRAQTALNKQQREIREAQKQQALLQMTNNVREHRESIVVTYRDAVTYLEYAISYAKQAEEFRDAQAYSAFWETVETGVGALAAHKNNVARVVQEGKSYRARVRNLVEKGGSAPDVPSEMVFVSDSGLGQRLTERYEELVRSVQSDYHFATIYEQRRTTAAVIDGFKNLTDAVNAMGNSIRRANTELVESLGQTRSDSAPLLQQQIDPLSQHDSFGQQIVQINRTLETVADRLR